MLEYIAVVAVLFLLALLRNHLRERKLQKQQAQQAQQTGQTARGAGTAAASRPPREERVTKLFDGAAGRLKMKGLDWLMLEDYHFRTRISRPGSVSLEETRQELQSALSELLSHVHIMPDVMLEVTNDPSRLSGPNRAGEYNPDPRNKTIRVLVGASPTGEDLLHVLCHEAAHYIMYSLNVASPDPDLNEGLTDVTACLLGFSEAMISPNCDRAFPYLNRAEFDLVRKLLLQRRAVLRQQRDRSAELAAARQQLQKDLAAARAMLEQVRAMMAVNKTPSAGRMSKTSFALLQNAMLALENGSYLETLQRSQAALKQGPDEVHRADEQVLNLCGDLFRVMLAFS